MTRYEMAPRRPIVFTATTYQIATYLLAVCPFSIAFLVFLNSSISFVVTDLIGLRDGEGDAVGSLGFADELLALVACPVWGLLSDRVGVRYVCTAGYAIIALSLVLFVQARNVYPQLLLGRLLFSLGGSAVSTMVTAVLHTVSRRSFQSSDPVSDHGSQQFEQNGHPRQAQGRAPSYPSDATITPATPEYNYDDPTAMVADASSYRIAGFVGFFAGCGALIALGLFLPLPAGFERFGWSPDLAITRSYYVVSTVALAISISCFIGLRNIHGEEEKGWLSLGKRFKTQTSSSSGVLRQVHTELCSYWGQLSKAFTLGFKNPVIGLGYIGGFVARASSVGISLFIPLFVNRYYRESGLCHGTQLGQFVDSQGEIKKSCPEAYILASILTGVSQLVALVAAPVYGYLSERWQRYHSPLHFSAVSGLVGYIGFPLLPSPQFRGPDGNLGVFIIMALIGISQIGAIICSLAVLNNGVLNTRDSRESSGQQNSFSEISVPESGTLAPREVDRTHIIEETPLLGPPVHPVTIPDLRQMKGAVAGMYSLFGGVGILVLTKIGGLLFDTISPGSPFYILAVFNGILVVVCIWSSIIIGNSQLPRVVDGT